MKVLTILFDDSVDVSGLPVNTENIKVENEDGTVSIDGGTVKFSGQMGGSPHKHKIAETETGPSEPV